MHVSRRNGTFPFVSLLAVATFSLLLVLNGLAVQAAVPAGESQENPEWKVGVASAKVTPDAPLPMAGYAGRKEPAEGTEQDLFAKAILFEDSTGKRVVFITLDLIGVTHELRTHVAEQVAEKFGIASEALLMNASHTHCGPAYGRDESAEYFAWLKDRLVQLVGESLESLEPASLPYSHAKCSVAMNRRTPTATGYRNHPNPDGLVDHTVPVLAAYRPDGDLRAVVFGYACHNTTMGFRKWLGDYAGFAQEYFQADHPGVTALFMMGCGGDQNPYPRSELKYAQMHGRSLATSIEAALEENQGSPLHRRVVHGPLRSTLQTVDLSFETPNRPDVAYPVQVIRFGNDIMLIALGSPVTVDYSPRMNYELTRPPGPAISLAGYPTPCDGYIPSRRVLLEGGYEAASRPWKPDLEERIITKVHQIVGEREGQPATAK